MEEHQSGYRYLAPHALAGIKNLTLVARGVVEGFISGLHASPYKGFSVEFAEHREYVAGDDPRRIDYRMLARTDRLYVKQYEEETNMRVQILLDASGSMNYRHEGKMSKFEYGCHLAAVLGYLMLRQQDAVGLTAFDRQLKFDLAAHASPRHFNEMMQRLEVLEPGGETDISAVLHRLAERFQRRRLIVLISDLYGEPKEISRALHHFRHRHHEVIVFHVLDKAETAFPFNGVMAFRDLETGERIELDASYLRNYYLSEIAEFQSQYRRACAEASIDYVLAETGTPYELMLVRYLAARNHR